MPLTPKGKKIMAAMMNTYHGDAKKAKRVLKRQ